MTTSERTLFGRSDFRGALLDFFLRSETTFRDWIRRFKDGDFDVDDRPREGKPKIFEDAELEALLDEDPCQTQEKLASVLGVTGQAIFKRLHALGMIQKQET